MSGRNGGTYTILLTGFRLSLPSGADEPPLVCDVRLTVRHPGPGFADAIESVMSYEDAIAVLRRQDTGTDGGNADVEQEKGERAATSARLAERLAERLASLPDVCHAHLGIRPMTQSRTDQDINRLDTDRSDYIALAERRADITERRRYESA